MIPNSAISELAPDRQPAPRSPQPPTRGGPVELVDEGPLYAGVGVAAITDIPAAAELVRSLAP